MRTTAHRNVVLLIAAYSAVESAWDLIGGHHPAVSWIGVGFSAITLVAMPRLGAAQLRVATALGSSAAAGESRQTMLRRCGCIEAWQDAAAVANCACSRSGP